VLHEQRACPLSPVCSRYGGPNRSGFFLQCNITVYLHYITLHYITLRYVTLRYVTLRYITLHYIACPNFVRLQVNEFHHAPVDFIFTSPLNDSVLPPLRVSGDGVLKEFGFVPGRGLMDAAMVWLLVACFGMLTYFFLETAGRQVSKELLV